MPRISKASAASSSPAKLCFPHHHMTATEYAIYDVCRALAAAHDGVVFFSGPKIAAKFRSMSRNTPYIALKSLVASGWFVLVKHSHIDAATGRNTATHYKVLSHGEWCARHPNACPNNSRDWQEVMAQVDTVRPNGRERPSKFEVTDRPNLSASPSKPQGTNLYQPIGVTHTSTDTVPLPSKSEGMDHAPILSDCANDASASILVGRPYPENGTVDSAVSTIMTALGETASTAARAWRQTVARLSDQGNSPDVVADTLRYFTNAYPTDSRGVTADSFATSFPWLLRELTDKQIEEMKAA